MMYLYNTFIYEPIFNLLVWVYNFVPGHDLGVTIVIITLLIRLILYPLTQKSLKNQKALTAIQPKIKELQDKYKGEQQTLAAELMKLYKQENVHPMSSCLPLLIQLPVLIAVYHVFQKGITSQGFDILYSFVQNPGSINTFAFGFIDLAKASIPIAVLAGLAQFWQTKMMTTTPQPPKNVIQKIEGSKDEGMMANMNKQMLYMMPILTVVIGFKLPAGLTFYWLITTLFMVFQQMSVLKPINLINKKLDATTVQSGGDGTVHEISAKEIDQNKP